MMDYSNNKVMDRLLRQLFRGKPFTKAIPFNRNLPSATGIIDLWVPSGAFFEIAIVTIRCTVAGVDLTLADTTADNPFLFVMPDTTKYDQYPLYPGYRSLNTTSKVVLANPAGTVAQVKGVLFGYEVTKEGHYR